MPGALPDPDRDPVLGPDLTLDDQLCFAAYTASRAITQAYRDGLREAGLTYTQYLVMLLLWESPTLSMGVIGRRLHLDSATLSPVLRRMASDGLLTRSRSSDDERHVDVTITEAGRDLRSRVHEVQRGVERATRLSSDDLARLRSQLHEVAANLRAPGPRGTPGAAALS